MPLSPLPTPFPYTTLFRSPQWKQVHPGLYHREYGRAQVGRVRAHPSLPWSWREVGRPSFEGEVDVMKARAESRGVRQSARKKIGRASCRERKKSKGDSRSVR